MINRLRDNFTQVDNNILNNQKLSLKSKGLYAFLCSKPDNWDFSYNGLIHQLQEGEKAIRNAVKELVDQDVLLRIPKKIGNSFAGWEWIINPSDEDLQNGKDPTRKTPKQEVPILATSQDGEEISNNKKSNTKTSNTQYIDDEKLNGKILEFIENRKQLKKPMTDLAIEKLVDKTKKWTASYSIDDISGFFNTAIECGWQGVFEPKKGFQKSSEKKMAYEGENARGNWEF